MYNISFSKTYRYEEHRKLSKNCLTCGRAKLSTEQRKHRAEPSRNHKMFYFFLKNQKEKNKLFWGQRKCSNT